MGKLKCPIVRVRNQGLGLNVLGRLNVSDSRPCEVQPSTSQRSRPRIYGRPNAVFDLTGLMRHGSTFRYRPLLDIRPGMHLAWGRYMILTFCIHCVILLWPMSAQYLHISCHTGIVLRPHSMAATSVSNPFKCPPTGRDRKTFPFCNIATQEKRPPFRQRDGKSYKGSRNRQCIFRASSVSQRHLSASAAYPSR